MTICMSFAHDFLIFFFWKSVGNHRVLSGGVFYLIDILTGGNIGYKEEEEEEKTNMSLMSSHPGFTTYKDLES